jgi:hypothetical protein
VAVIRKILNFVVALPWLEINTRLGGLFERSGSGPKLVQTLLFLSELHKSILIYTYETWWASMHEHTREIPSSSDSSGHSEMKLGMVELWQD